MKKIIVVVGFLLFAGQPAGAQIPIWDIIKEAVTSVIVAVDLKIQRLQNETIWLQNAQKTLENELSKAKLAEIAGWVEKQKNLYDDYFRELWEVKAALAQFYRVKEMLDHAGQLVKEYKEAWNRLSRDGNFTAEERHYMFRVYTGILERSALTVEELSKVLLAYLSRMGDAARLERVNELADQVEQQLADLRQFNQQNTLVALQRAMEKGEIEMARKIYGF